jgi:hypothetical protein
MTPRVPLLATGLLLAVASVGLWLHADQGQEAAHGLASGHQLTAGRLDAACRADAQGSACREAEAADRVVKAQARRVAELQDLKIGGMVGTSLGLLMSGGALASLLRASRRQSGRTA